MNNETLLFDTQKVKKFFDILAKLGRVIEERYDGSCEREIFVNRTINKWFKNKYFIWYKKSEQTGEYFRCYISIFNIKYALTYGIDLELNYYDYTKPMDVWNSIKLSHNDVINLEGEYCKTPKVHQKLLELTMINIPEKEYFFKAYDWNKYPKRKKKNQTDNDIYKLMETQISFKATTRAKAYNLKKEFEKNRTKDSKMIIFPDIIKIE